MIYKIAGNDALATYGLIFNKGTYEELLKMPTPKGGYSKSWEDEHGTERDLSTVYFESRSIDLPVTLLANSEAQFYSRYNALRTFLLTAGYFDFDVIQMNRRFRLVYRDMTPFGKLTVIRGNGNIGAEFTLKLVDDFPTTNTQLVDPATAIYYGADSSSTITAASIKLLPTTNLLTFTMNTGLTNRWRIAYPDHRTLISVNDNDTAENLTSNYVLSPLVIDGKNYTVATMQNAIAYSTNHLHLITIING